jgi:hypothetical protein
MQQEPHEHGETGKASGRAREQIAVHRAGSRMRAAGRDGGVNLPVLCSTCVCHDTPRAAKRTRQCDQNSGMDCREEAETGSSCAGENADDRSCSV